MSSVKPSECFLAINKVSLAGTNGWVHHLIPALGPSLDFKFTLYLSNSFATEMFSQAFLPPVRILHVTNKLI